MAENQAATNQNSGNTGSGQQPTTQISEEQAKQIALEHAQIKESDAAFLWAKLDYDDGVLVYDVEFYIAETNTEYDYEIDAENYTPFQQGAQSGQQITEQEAKQIALAKVSGATERDIRLHLDYDDGWVLYEGKIIYQNIEYDFSIDAYSGTILEWEAESVFD